MLALDERSVSAFTRLDAFCEAGPGRANEDRAGTTESAAWVLDGTTGLSQRRLLPGPSDAAWFVDTVDRTLRSLPTDLDMPGLLRQMGRSVRREMEAALLGLEGGDLERPAASLALARCRDDGSLELANVGDCRILHRDRRGTVTAFGSSPVSELDRQVVAELVRLRAQGVESYTEAWSHLVDVIRRNRTLANRDGGYWVIDHTERWLPQVQHRLLPWCHGEHLLLLSDGFYRLVDTFGFWTDTALFEAALDGGLAELGRQLRATEKGDPECRSYPRIKVHDDATALLVRQEGGR